MPTFEWKRRRVSAVRADGAKLCLACEAWKSPEEFGWTKPGRRAPRCLECERARLRAYLATPEGRAAHRASWAKYQASNAERCRARVNAYYATHPETRRVKESRRRARKRGLASTMTKAELAQIVESFGGRCAYCLRTDVKLTTDHVTAIARGGADTPDNVVPACASCNARKGERGVLYMLNKCASASRAA
jgi:5-methylcytosine-specific restriction endonuclease McrA